MSKKTFLAAILLTLTLSTSLASINSNLSLGVTSSEVKELQSFLIGKGMLSGTATGYYGSLTTSAVKLYQKSVGIESTGTVGPLTRKSINNSNTVSGSSIVVSTTVSTSTKPVAASSTTPVFTKPVATVAKVISVKPTLVTRLTGSIKGAISKVISVGTIARYSYGGGGGGGGSVYVAPTPTPVNGSCGASSGLTVSSTPTTLLCTVGSASSVSGTSTFLWSCAGTDGGSTASCSATLSVSTSTGTTTSTSTPTPVNGVCGSANGTSRSSIPSSNLCSAGATSSVTGTGPWAWSCAGVDGGTNASCGASVTVVNGSCGASNGAVFSSAPSASLCNTGSASTVTGSGPWSWSCSSAGGSTATCGATVGVCTGSVTPAIASVILPPSVPQVSGNSDIVGVIVQNLNSSVPTSRYVTFGQIFKKTQVQPSDILVAHIYSSTYQVQMDSQTLWNDGSVKMAALTLQLPNTCASSNLPIMISKKTGNDPTFSTTPINLATSTFTLNTSMNFTAGQYSGVKNIDIATALRSSLSVSSTTDYWLRGPLATQARVDIPMIGGPMHITADVTLYKDGTVSADVQYNNDLTEIIVGHGYSGNPSPLARQEYSANIFMNGATTTFNGPTISTQLSVSSLETVNSIAQYQYQNWHTVVTSNTLAKVNVQHDINYLKHTGAILSYDLTTGVNNNQIQNQVSYLESNFNTPLARNNILMYMGQTGGRADIGYTTMWNTMWIVTQDSRIADIALAQGDTSGAIPWNWKIASTGRWANVLDSPSLWADSRSDNGDTTLGNQPLGGQPYWQIDAAHQPNLSYIPYIMTGTRWYLDRLNAVAAQSITTSYGKKSVWNTNDIILNNGEQLRGNAWTIREVQEAAFVAKTGSWEETYFTNVVNNNYAWMNTQYSVWGAAQGELAGYKPNAYGSDGSLSTWQQDFFTGVVALGAQMGFTGPLQYINWQRDGWLAGRFVGNGMNPYDGCSYILKASFSTDGGNTFTPYNTWASMEAATVAAGWSNGNGWTSMSDGYYCGVARTALSSALTLFPNDNLLLQALTWLNAANAPHVNTAEFRDDPTYNVVPLN